MENITDKKTFNKHLEKHADYIEKRKTSIENLLKNKYDNETIIHHLKKLDEHVNTTDYSLFVLGSDLGYKNDLKNNYFLWRDSLNLC